LLQYYPLFKDLLLFRVPSSVPQN